jgi:hypothetical protein
MTDAEIQKYLADYGYPKHVVEGGREGLLKRYTQFVEEVERGYDLSIYDYRNDLDGRAIIRLVGLDTEVQDLDQRLKEMLVHDEVRVWESAPDDPFWDFGYPKNARGELLQDLESEGLASSSKKKPVSRGRPEPPQRER